MGDSPPELKDTVHNFGIMKRINNVRPLNTMKPLFVYGTLLFKEIMLRVAGKTFSASDAMLNDYIRFRVRNAPYPGIVFRKGSSVQGTLFHHIDAISLQKIDRYEGDLYERFEAYVMDNTGAPHHSYAYRIKDEFAYLVTEEAWSRERFLQNEIQRFMNELDGDPTGDITADLNPFR